MMKCQMIGGQHDGRVMEVHGNPLPTHVVLTDLAEYEICLPDPSEHPEPSKLRTLIYFRKYKLHADGVKEIVYVWDGK